MQSLSANKPTVLHLLDPAASGDAGVSAYRALAQSDTGYAHEAWVIGASDAGRRVREMGVCVARQLGVRTASSGEWGGATWAMREAVRERFAVQGAARPAVVVGWSARVVSLMRRIVPTATPWLAVLGEPAWECRIGGDSGVLGSLDRVPIVCGSEVMRARWQAYREHHALDVRVLPIGVATMSNDERRRERDRVRDALGIGDDRLVVSLLADGAPRGDSMWFAFFIGLLFVAGIPAVGLVPAGFAGDGGTVSMRRAARYTALHGRRWWFREIDASLATMLAASDLCVRQAGVKGMGGEHGMPAISSCDEAALLLAASMGVTIVQDDEPMVRELLEPGHGRAPDLSVARAWAEATAFVPPTRARGEVSGTAGALIALARDPEWRRRLTANLRARAASRRDAWPAAFAELLDERIGKPMVREGLPTPNVLAGAGMSEAVGARR